MRRVPATLTALLTVGAVGVISGQLLEAGAEAAPGGSPAKKAAQAAARHGVPAKKGRTPSPSNSAGPYAAAATAQLAAGASSAVPGGTPGRVVSHGGKSSGGGTPTGTPSGYVANGKPSGPAAGVPGGRTLYVSTRGSDRNPGTSSQPLRTVNRAVALATPGTTIRVRTGTYNEKVSLRTSGTSSKPMVLTTAGDGPVTLTHSVKAAKCSSLSPASDRTIEVLAGADNWTVQGFTIVNGVFISGQQQNAAYAWFTKKVSTKDWKARRAVPGRGSNNRADAAKAVSYLRSKTGADIDPSDGIKIIGNVITGRGIHSALGRNGEISGNTVRDIACGTGPGMWLITFSDGWTIRNNWVHHVAASTGAHFMQEGIRLGSSSDYNTVEYNRVEDLPGDGRAFNTDVDSSWNTFRHNNAARVAIGYNDQMAGWGNVWEHNAVTSYRDYGFGFRLMDAKLTSPSMHSSTYRAVVRCNAASGTGRDLGVGAVKSSAFTGNTFSPVWVSSNAQHYWRSQGNSWNGSAGTPSTTPSATTKGC